MEQQGPPRTPTPSGSITKYKPFPGRNAYGDSAKPVWRIKFSLVSDPSKQFGIDLNGDAVLGRGQESYDTFDLTDAGGENQGVSRRHAMIRPTPSNLFITDMGSKNGTLRNGQSIGVNTPYTLVNGDVLMLGRLGLVLHIIERPVLQTAPDEPISDITDALAQIAKSITTQLNLEDVLNQITEAAMKLTSAGEAGIWLADDQSGVLYLEAERGIEDERIKRMRIPIRPDNLVGQVYKSGTALRDHRQPGADQIKVKTGYLVEALVFLPIKLGGVTIGVLMAAHSKPGQTFTPEDERLLGNIADFAAIAIQNARLYRATDEALERRVHELGSLNQLTYAISSTLDLNHIHSVMVEQIKEHWEVEDVLLWLADDNGTLSPFAADKDKIAMLQTTTAGQVEKFVNEIASTGLAKASDFLGQEDTVSGAGPRATIKIQARSIAAIPLHIQGRLAGVVALLRKKVGMFNPDDLDHLVSFATPVSTAIQNARLFADAERQWSATYATAQTISEPLIILDESGNVIIANERANDIIRDNMSALFDGISRSVGKTAELVIGDRTYLTTSQHSEGVGTIVVMQDISYVKKLEQNRLEFVHTLTHDLKSPLTSIKGWAQLVEKTVTLDDKSGRFVSQIIASADRMVGMINELLQSIREEENIKFQFEPSELGPIIDRALSEVEGTALNKSIQITVERPQTPLHIMADPDRMYHLTLNLLSNAVKYTPEDGAVLLEVTDRDTGIEIRVADNGPGIPEDDLPHIFERYFRSKSTRHISGAGVGLAVVKAIIEGHGGTIDGHNRQDGGAEFVVKLPPNIRLNGRTQ